MTTAAAFCGPVSSGRGFFAVFCGGVYFTIRTRFPQLRLFGESIHVVMEKPSQEGSISSFGALTPVS